METILSRRALLAGTTATATIAATSNFTVTRAFAQSQAILPLKPGAASQLHREAMTRAWEITSKTKQGYYGSDTIKAYANELLNQKLITKETLTYFEELIEILTLPNDPPLDKLKDQILAITEKIKETASDVGRVIAEIVEDSITFLSNNYSDIKSKIEDPENRKTVAKIVLKDMAGAISGGLGGAQFGPYVAAFAAAVSGGVTSASELFD